ncbi:MAG: pseudouridine synthase, partial [Chromatiales bacterium]
RDDHYVAVDKPPGVLVHRSALSRDRIFVLQRLRAQLGKRLYPIHRLDRATSGVLVFGLTPEAAAALAGEFRAGRISKTYLAVVRGHPDAEGVVDRPVRDRDDGRQAEARTRYRRLATAELAVAVTRYPTSRYALVEACPETGRRHQLRQHFKHIFHPVIGDTTYGEGRHNRFFRERFGVHCLLLRARGLSFTHPKTGRGVHIRAEPGEDWLLIARGLGWEKAIRNPWRQPQNPPRPPGA